MATGAATNPIPATGEKQHAAFFRQSGWLIIATIAGGLMSLGIHFLSNVVPTAEYSIYGTMLMVTTCIPAMPLQMVFTQQGAQALALNRERRLSGMIRLACLWIFILWVLATLIVLTFQGRIVERWQLGTPAALWVTLPVVLVSLLMPMFAGAQQGKQDFFWLGWSAILSGVARFGTALLLVLAFHAGATGMMAGMIGGVTVAAVIGIWRTRDIWTLPSEPFDGRAIVGQVVPLMLGFGACQFLFAADTMFAKSYFTGEQLAPYIATGTMSRALLWLVLPLASVMFPKIVHANAKSEKHNLLGIVLLGTAILGIVGGAGLCVFGPMLVKLVHVFPEAYIPQIRALLPWYAGAMVPLALANVLVNDLLARSQLRVVPAMVLVTVAYAFTLNFMLHKYPGRLEVVLQTLTVFNLLLFGICAWFVFRKKEKTDWQT